MSISHDNFLAITIENIIVHKNETTVVEGANFPRLFRLIIGINDYPGTYNDLIGCVNDAEGYYDVLVEDTKLNTHYYSSYGRIITDSDATKANIKNAIIDLGKVMQPKDHLVITFSGHGGPLYNNGTDEQGTKTDEGILVYDSIDRYGYLTKAGYITDDEMEEWVSTNISSSNILFIFDSCYSEGMYHSIYNVPLIQTRDLWGHGYAVITSANDEEYAWSDTGLGHGVFTYFFLEGIRTRAADENNDGNITASEAFNYAEPAVRSYMGNSYYYSEIQHPQMFLEGYDPIIYRY